jgi:citrate lyase beta subunit
MPGDDRRKIEKAITLGVDCICMDMEDGVALSRKEPARQTIASALSELEFGTAEKLARINRVGSGLEALDLKTVLPARPDGIVVPKVERADELRWVSDQLAAAEAANGWQPGSIGLIAIIETARGIVNLAQIAAGEARLQALVFGAEDLAGDIGARRSPEGWEVFYARSAVVTHAAAFDIQAIDMVYIDFLDEAGLYREAILGAGLGYSGKQVIHPRQVAPVQAAFTPTDEEIQQAQRVMAAFETHQRAGLGAFALDGKMIDAPMVKAAEGILARARAAGKIRG